MTPTQKVGALYALGFLFFRFFVFFPVVLAISPDDVASQDLTKGPQQEGQSTSSPSVHCQTLLFYGRVLCGGDGTATRRRARNLEAKHPKESVILKTPQNL